MLYHSNEFYYFCTGTDNDWTYKHLAMLCLQVGLKSGSSVGVYAVQELAQNMHLFAQKHFYWLLLGQFRCRNMPLKCFLEPNSVTNYLPHKQNQ